MDERQEHQAELLSEVYDELRAVAARLMRREASDLTLQPTDLVNEAATRVLAFNRMAFKDRQHMLATCSRVLRQVMLDEIRKRRRLKRQVPDITLVVEGVSRPVDVEAVEAALVRLEVISPELASLVDMRFFAGLSVEDIAQTTGISERTVKRRWQTARAWLAEELADD